MLDIHTHIIPGIDDGSKSMIDTLNILKNAIDAGYTGIVATPHYIEGSYMTNNDDKNRLINDIKNEAKLQNINIDIYFGNEVFITENIENLLYSGKIYSINNSKYVLVELPMSGGASGLQSCIFKLFSMGYTPIIAHPERYSFVQKDPNRLLDYIEQGVLFQLNSGSLFGHYGKTAQNAAKILLKHNMIQFIATDTHSSKSSSYSQIGDVRKLVSKLTWKENVDDLMTNNPTYIVNNKRIEITQPLKYKKSLFNF